MGLFCELLSRLYASKNELQIYSSTHLKKKVHLKRFLIVIF